MTCSQQKALPAFFYRYIFIFEDFEEFKARENLTKESSPNKILSTKCLNEPSASSASFAFFWLMKDPLHCVATSGVTLYGSLEFGQKDHVFEHN